MNNLLTVYIFANLLASVIVFGLIIVTKIQQHYEQ